MGFLDRLFGRRPRRPDPRQLLETIFAFIQAETWAESRRIVEEHPELLSDEADGLLGQLIEAARELGEGDAVRLLEEHRALLRRCREVGVERAFAEEVGAQHAELLLEALQAFVAADTWDESRRIVEEHPELLSDEADALLGRMLEAEEVRRTSEVRRTLEKHRALLRRCREVGVARAFAERVGSSVPSAEAIRRHPLYLLAEKVLRGEMSLEEALRQATAPETLAALDDAALNRLNDYIVALSRDPARPTEARVLAYLLAELNHAAAQALPASPPTRAYTANTLGNCIDDFPFKTPAHLERRVAAYREALAIWQERGEQKRIAMLQNNLGLAYRHLAQVREREANLERAIAAYREALTVYTPDQAPLEYATTQNNLGTAYLRLTEVRDREANLGRAIEAYREALTVYTPDRAPLHYAVTQNNLGSAYLRLAQVRDREANLGRAIEAYREALRFWTPNQAPLEYAGTQNNLGNAYLRLAQVRERERNLGRAIEAYREALRFRPPDQAPLEYATTQNNLGNAYADLAQVRDREANLGRAIEAYREALRFWTPNQAPLEYATTQNNLGAAYARLAQVRDREANLERAIEAFREALRFRPSDQAPLDYAATQNNLGGAYADLAQVRDREANLGRAIAAFQEALRFRPPDQAPLEYATTQNNLGNAYADLAQVRDREANLGRAIAAYREALRFRTPDQAPLEYATTQNNLGAAYADLAQVRDWRANLERAIEAFREALTVYTPDQAPLDYAMTQNNLGNAYLRLAQVRDREVNLGWAIEAYREALTVYTPDRAPLDYAMTQNNLGLAYWHLAQVREREANLGRAIAAYREALRFYTPDRAPLDYAATQSNLGLAYADLAQVREREANLGRAIEAYREALRFRTPDQAPLEYATTQNNLGTAYADLAEVRDREANLGRAIEAYEEALAMIDRFFLASSVGAQIGLQERWAGLYVRAVSAYRRAGRPAPAFATAEGSKSRILTGLLGRGAIPAPPTVPTDLAQREQALASELAALDAAALARLGATTPEGAATPLRRQERRLELVDQLRDLWQRMASYGDAAADYVALRRGDPPTWEDLVALAADLGPETALLSLFTTGGETLLFILRAGEEAPAVVEVPLGADELRYVYWANYRDEILNRRRHRAAGRPLTHRWRRLGERLLAPALSHLEGASRLVIAPEGLFHLLPLHALDLDGKGMTLLDRFAVSYIPALGLLTRLRRRPPVTSGAALVVGYTPADPSTEKGRVERDLFLGEARAVADLAGVRPLLDGEAKGDGLRQRLTGQTFRLIHLSCHGGFDPNDPLRSGVLLADGLFTAREWMEVRFRADLVTLSACQTGLVGRMGGDELAGLSQALLYAGASSLLLGLWSVNAATTAALMVDLYRRLWDARGRKRTDEATALREAALALRDGRTLPPEMRERMDTTDPYYWAPFILVGDWR